MSDKPKREITLGEMQDACSGVQCDDCKYKEVCPYETNKPLEAIDLTDPPRFTEAQMAFLRAWYEIGARSISWDGDNRIFYITKPVSAHMSEMLGGIAMAAGKLIGLEADKSTDLAELFGKEEPVE